MLFAALWLGLAAASAASPLRVITIDPGHFHVALIQKEALPELAEDAWIFAPLGPGLTAHLNRVAAFNARQENPTRWRLHVYAAPDYYERLLGSPPGEVMHIRNPASLPSWEKPNMLAKYYLTTRGVELARQGARP